MNVLSLFDGMSCGQLALNRANIKYDKYFASEIDKYAIKVTQANYPNTIQLGDITKWKTWNLPKIDLILAGSPCQGFSLAGKQLNFKDERSKLFFTFVDILKHYKPKYFLLENVVMKQNVEDAISGLLGEIYPECITQPEMFRQGRLEPIMINSALVSAQHRKRLYWTNIPDIKQPEDKGILLKHIIERLTPENSPANGMTLNCQVNKRKIKKNVNRLCIQAGEADLNGNDSLKRVYSVEGKSPCLTANCGGNQEPKVAIKEEFYKNRDSRIYTNKSPTLRSERSGLQTTTNGITWRKLTPLECERLQTVPDNYSNYTSNSQRYKMLGNGWTVDVICHILNHIPLSDFYDS